MFNLVPELGIDLGTTNILVYLKGKGIVLREPCVVAKNVSTGGLLAVGTEAQEMLGKTPGNIQAVCPMSEGVIADYSTTLKMLEFIIAKVCGRSLLGIKPIVIIAVPSEVTPVEKGAVTQAAREAGAKQAYPIEEPRAAAIGAGLPISKPGGNMIVDLGGGTTDIAVLSLDGTVISKSIRVGGIKMDEVIQRHIKNKYNLMIGDRTAEEIKLKIGSASPLQEELLLDVKGRDLVAGLPKVVTISSLEIREALDEPVTAIMGRIKNVLELTPPELSADIIERGIVLTGGVALLRGLDQRISKETGIHVIVAEDPLSCVAVGCGKALDQLDAIRDQFIETGFG